jgi:hypothetical protein
MAHKESKKGGGLPTKTVQNVQGKNKFGAKSGKKK